MILQKPLMLRKQGIGAVSLVSLLAGYPALAGVADIRSMYQEINALVESKTAKPVSVFLQDGVGWRLVTTRAEQDEFDKNDFRARVYLHENKVVKAQLETTSQSGDWKLTDEYYFYKSGRTAFFFRTLLTFQGYDAEHDRELPPGPYVVEERVYFDDGGERLRRLIKAYVQKGGKSIDRKYLATGPMRGEIFPNVVALPFHSLIKTR